MKKGKFLKVLSIIYLLSSFRCEAQSYDNLLVKNINEKIIIVQTERGSGNCLALKTNKGLVVFGTSWGTDKAMEYRRLIEDEFKNSDFKYIINTDYRIVSIGGNSIYQDALIIAQDEIFQEILYNQKNLDEEIQKEITIFNRKAQRSRNILKNQDISKSDSSLHKNWMDHCQRIADDLNSGYELILPSVIFKEELILALGNMTLHLKYFPNNGLIAWIPEENFLSFTGMFDPMHIITSTLRPTNKKLEIDKWIEILDEYTLKCRDVEQVILGYKGLWPMSKIKDRNQYIKQLWSLIKQSSAENMSFNQVLEELSINKKFTYLKDWDLYKEKGEDWLIEDHNTHITAFWLQLHPPLSTYIMNYVDQNGEADGQKEFSDIIKNRTHEFFITENQLNDLGYYLIEKGMMSFAINVFKMNTVSYPESANTFDSLAEAYMKNGQRNEAITTYEKSLELNPDNENAKEMLERLKTAKKRN